MNARGTTVFTSAIFFLLILFLSPELACGVGTPSAADGERAVQDAINQESAGRIKLINFTKTDALEYERLGIKIYSQEFQIEIQFLENCRWINLVMGTQLTFRTAKLSPKSNNSLKEFNENLQSPGTDVTRGQRLNVVGVVNYVKKESGWVLDSVQPMKVVAASQKPIRAPDHPASATSTEVGPAAVEKHDKPSPQQTSSDCVLHLKMIALALRTWAVDHDGDFPFNVSTNKGGTKELCSSGNDGFDRNAFLHFKVLSGELVFAKILLCPADSSKHPADSFQSLQPDNVTYQIRSGVDIRETNPQEIIIRCPIHGHVARCDGSITIPSTTASAPTSATPSITPGATGQGADEVSRVAGSRTAFENLTDTLPDKGLFPNHVTVYELPYDKVWEAASQALIQQKETILRSEKEKGVLMTDLTRHSVIGIPSYERYCLLLEKQNDSSTRMTFVLQTYLKNILAKKGSANELKAASHDLVNTKTKLFLGKIEQNLRKSR